MTDKIQTGFLTLADISGYTSFMAATELEHSHEILTDLIHVIIGSLTPMYELAEVEGDAVFVFAPEQKFSRGESLIELIETSYYDFRKRRDIMHARTNCTCRACQCIPSLDLKFITHFGSYVLQKVAGLAKPIGSDVNAAHRLLKNKVSEVTGWKGYALFSETALNKLDVSLRTGIEISENYEHIGPINTLNVNLNDSYESLDSKKQVRVTEGDSDLHNSFVLKSTPPVVWDWLNDPYKRSQWMVGTKWTKGNRPKGRTSAGATNHCEHSSGKMLETILDWKPFTYYTTLSGKKPMMVYMTQMLESRDDFTLLNTYIKLKTPLPKWLRKKLAAMIAKKVMKMEECQQKMAELIEGSVPPSEGG